jgi:hypothetical protein
MMVSLKENFNLKDALISLGIVRYSKEFQLKKVLKTIDQHNHTCTSEKIKIAII